jgi:hypothetical protein
VPPRAQEVGNRDHIENRTLFAGHAALHPPMHQYTQRAAPVPPAPQAMGSSRGRRRKPPRDGQPC